LSTRPQSLYFGSIVWTYPVLAFFILSGAPFFRTWTIPLIFALSFCLLWKNAKHCAYSNLLLWVLTAPAWWLYEHIHAPPSAVHLLASWPFIALMHVFLVFVPQLLIVLVRNHAHGAWSGRRTFKS